MSLRLTPLFIAISFVISACENTEANQNDGLPNVPGVVQDDGVPVISNKREESPEQWFAEGQLELQNALSQQANTSPAKNIILFVGDGMGISTITAARILEGQLKGANGEENSLSFEHLPYLAHAKVYNTNQQIPDSAGTMSAMMSGIKTKAGLIGLNQNVTRGICDPSKETETTSFLTLAENHGLATGIISTAGVTHATSAATYAHAADRNWESWIDLPPEARSAGCKDIADQLIQFPAGDGLDVALGGGRSNFLPRDSAFNSGEQSGAIEGLRTDGRNLVEEWKTNHPQGRYIIDQAGFDSIDTEQTTKLLGLFNEYHMHYERDRKSDILGEPSLSEMTLKAIQVLDNNPKGFFLMVEAGRIDEAHHIGSAAYALSETIELSNAVRVALENTSSDNTLIIVAADHSNAMTMAGYTTRGNPILGPVIGNTISGVSAGRPTLAADGYAFTTLTYANGRGYAEGVPGDERYNLAIDNQRHDITNVDTQDPGFHQDAAVPTARETHSGEDVAIYASGPWAHLFHKTHEQNYVFHVMNHALFNSVEGQ